MDVVDATGRLGASSVGAVCAALTRCLAEFGAAGELRVRVVDDAEMSALHLERSSVPGPTDVLTFDLSDGDGLDCDVTVCLDEAARRASGDVAPELVLYALHGALHCLGFDDRSNEDAARMHAEEDRLLEAAGLGRVFAEGQARADNAEADR
ncbi:MAG: rRNA maturation RNase YbeY [Planctomycetota bacterium]